MADDTLGDIGLVAVAAGILSSNDVYESILDLGDVNWCTKPPTYDTHPWADGLPNGGIRRIFLLAAHPREGRFI